MPIPSPDVLSLTSALLNEGQHFSDSTEIRDVLMVLVGLVGVAGLIIIADVMRRYHTQVNSDHRDD